MKMSNAYLVLAGTALMMVAGSAWAGIAGSKHDFSSTSWSTNNYGTNTAATKEICRPCHVPHKALSSSTVPLWNHTDSTNASYVLYSSPTMNATNVSTGVSQPTGISKVCLSCHDGSTALDSFGGVSGSAFIAPAGRVGFGGSLSKDHPIAFEYTAALATADGELYNPSTPSGIGSSISADMLFDNGSGSKTRVECASCHDVHNTKSAANSKLLLKSNANSALCLTCHNK